MEILEAIESNKIANRKLSLVAMVVKTSHQVAGLICECKHSKLQISERKDEEEEGKEEEAQHFYSNSNQEINTRRIKENWRRRRKQVVWCAENKSNCDNNSDNNKMIFKSEKFNSSTTPKMPLIWLAYLLLVPALLQVAFSPLPVAEAWNFFDGTQTSDIGKFASGFSNSSQTQSIHSMAASGLLNMASAAATSLVGGGDKHDTAAAAAAEPESSSMVLGGPSPFGKILQVGVATEQTNLLTSGNGSSDTARSASSIAMQLLKPRKSSSSSAQESSSKQQAAALEQQIINQHSRAHHHLSGGSHQRLLPTKHRDQKIVNSILESANSATTSSDGRDSPLASLFGGFKSSAITSRSSIVKAISDNKLARTLSTVSKTLGGNKYVAGAAAASALAALGLTVSKFLGPYFLAGGYNKLGADPMLGASSYQSSILVPQNSFSTDRNFVYTNPGSTDSMLASGSSGQSLIRVPSSSFLSYPSEITYDPATGSYEQTSVNGAYTGSPGGSSAQGPIYASSSSPDYYFTYTPRLKLSQPPGSSFSSSYSSSASATGGEPAIRHSADSANGHYSSFYSQPVDQSGQAYDQGATGYLSSPSQGFSAQSSNQEPTPDASSSLGNFYANNNNNNNNNNQLPYEQLLPEASVNSPSYSKPTQTAAATQSASDARRVGSVSLKMDDATRQRLFKHLLSQQKQQQPMRFSATPVSQQSLSSSSSGHYDKMGQRPGGQIAGVFVPISGATPSVEVYASSSGGAMVNSQQASSKSGRMDGQNGNGESGLYIGHGGISASLDNGQHQQLAQGQRQAQPVGSTDAGYLILRPNTERQQRQQQQSWRSLTTNEASKPAWQPAPAANKQIDDNSQLQQQQQQQQQSAGDYDQQASDSAPRSQVAQVGQPAAAATATGTANGREEQAPLSHRVSRTPNQSSVTELGSRRPVESLTDFDGEVKGLSGGSVLGSANLVPENSHRDQQQQQQQQPQPLQLHRGSLSSSDATAGGVKLEQPRLGEQKLLPQQQQVTTINQQQQQEQEIAAQATSGDDSKTNLIQLNNDNDEDNKNNVIKLIDANTNSGSDGKLTANSESQYGAGLVIMSPPSPSSLSSSGLMKNQRAAAANLDGGRAELSLDGQSRQQAATSDNHNSDSSKTHNHGNANTNQQRWIATTGKSQLSADFPEMGTLTRSFSDFAAGD